jgi:hypothetical protein
MVLLPMHIRLVKHTRMARDLRYPPSATRVPRLSIKASMDSPRAGWFILKGMVRWVITSKPIPTLPTSQATLKDNTKCDRTY